MIFISDVLILKLIKKCHNLDFIEYDIPCDLTDVDKREYLYSPEVHVIIRNILFNYFLPETGILRSHSRL